MVINSLSFKLRLARCLWSHTALAKVFTERGLRECTKLDINSFGLQLYPPRSPALDITTHGRPPQHRIRRLTVFQVCFSAYKLSGRLEDDLHEHSDAVCLRLVEACQAGIGLQQLTLNARQASRVVPLVCSTVRELTLLFDTTASACAHPTHPTHQYLFVDQTHLSIPDTEEFERLSVEIRGSLLAHAWPQLQTLRLECILTLSVLGALFSKAPLLDEVAFAPESQETEDDDKEDDHEWVTDVSVCRVAGGFLHRSPMICEDSTMQSVCPAEVRGYLASQSMTDCHCRSCRSTCNCSQMHTPTILHLAMLAAY